jgi:hypothetical protein
MRYPTRTITFVISLALVGASIGAASASTPWQRHHPWRVQVNQRLGNLNRRVNVERREGELTPREAGALHREDRTIRREERVMAGFNRTHLTRAEHRALNQQENALGRQIGR